jgi:hypothetical protein
VGGFAHTHQNSSALLSVCRPADSAAASAAAAAAIADYICKGPLLAAACITPAQVQQELGTWQKLGQQLALQLGFDHDSMDDIQK